MPMGAKTLQLTMGSEINIHPCVLQLIKRTGSQDMAIFIFLFRYHGAVAGPAIDDASGGEIEQPFFFPHIGMLIPIVFTAHTGVVDDKGWGIMDFRSRPEIHYITV